MTDADIPTVEHVLGACPEAAQWSPAQLLRESSARSLAFVAENQGEIVGMAALRTAADEAELLNLAVAPEHRRDGFGRALLVAAEGYARAVGVKQIFLEVRTSNAGARAFYAVHGFSGAGLRQNYYRDPVEDALVLSKVLS